MSSDRLPGFWIVTFPASPLLTPPSPAITFSNLDAGAKLKRQLVLTRTEGLPESQYREGRLAIKSISKREAVMWNSGF